MTKNIVQVAVPNNQDKAIFDYYIDQECNIGDLVKVSFRSKELLGIIWSKNKSEVAKFKLKSVQELYPISLSEAQLKFIKFIAHYNMAPLGAVIKLCLPIKEDAKNTQESEQYKIKLPELNEEQQAAHLSIAKHLDEYQVTLLDGVTGSGKTEVYSYIIAEILQKAKGQVLVLMPEIMLTQQFVERFKERFGSKPDIWHSKITPAQKRELWWRIASGEARFIIGARSALFLPFKDLDLIVLDEEHDSSYKQEEGIIYNARDMAVMRSHFHKKPLILASATPSIETLHNVTMKKYSEVNLSSRYGAGSMPEVSVVDMRESRLKRGQWLSPLLRKKIDNMLAQNKQVLLFLNRRGYAPISLCKACGHKEQCNNCESFLVVHKAKNKLMCHYCGYSKTLTSDCSSCKTKDSLITCGPGVERIAEEVAGLWPEAKSMIVTKDTVNEDQAGEVLQQIMNKEVDIIIGTQILSKGYHFPELNLVGVIDADIGLIGADLRASERTYQLLHQVSGRAGRESKGEVVIQTYYPDNQILSSLQTNNRQNFYQSELGTRKMVNMPPFNKLVAIILSGKTNDRVEKVAQDLAKMIPYTKEITVLGPAAAPIAMLRGKYRYRFLVRSEPNINIQLYIQQWLAQYTLPASVQLKTDVDPYSFL